MKKISIEDVKDVLLSHLQKDEVNKVIKEIEARVEDDSAPTTRKKKTKSSYYVVANTVNLTDEQKKLVGEIPLMVVRQEDSDDHTKVIENISAAIREHNLFNEDKPKKQVKTIFQGLERAPAKAFKPHKIKRDSKEIVMLIHTDNEIILH